MSSDLTVAIQLITDEPKIWTHTIQSFCNQKITKGMFIYKGKSLYLFTSTYHLLGTLLGLKKCMALPRFTHVLESYGGINLDYFLKLQR